MNALECLPCTGKERRRSGTRPGFSHALNRLTPWPVPRPHQDARLAGCPAHPPLQDLEGMVVENLSRHAPQASASLGSTSMDSHGAGGPAAPVAA